MVTMTQEQVKTYLEAHPVHNGNEIRYGVLCSKAYSGTWTGLAGFSRLGDAADFAIEAYKYGMAQIRRGDEVIWDSYRDRGITPAIREAIKAEDESAYGKAILAGQRAHASA